jgi:hypothetical protein
MGLKLSDMRNCIAHTASLATAAAAIVLLLLQLFLFTSSVSQSLILLLRLLATYTSHISKLRKEL